MRRAIGLGICGALGLAAVTLVSACRNTLSFGPPGTADCEFPGVICALGDADVGDGGPALNASFGFPTALDLDDQGRLYVADRFQNRIRLIDTSGNVTTIAGTGEERYDAGIGMPATETAVPSPSGVAVAPNGWAYWIQKETCTVWGLDPETGVSEHIAGTGRCESIQSRRLLEAGFDFSSCSRLSADERSNLIVADTGTRRVRYLNLGTGSVTVLNTSVPAGEERHVAGNGGTTVGNFVSATSIGVTPCHAIMVGDEMLVSDEYEDRIRRVAANGVISRVAGNGGQGFSGDGGPATSASIYDPAGLAWDPDADLLFIADRNARVRAVNLLGQPQQFGGLTIGTGFILTVAGNGTAGPLIVGSAGALEQSFDFGPGAPMVLDSSGNLLIADSDNDVIRRVDRETGAMTVVAGFSGAGVLEGFLARPTGLALAPDGALYVTARTPYLHRVEKSGGRSIVAGNGSPDAQEEGSLALDDGFWGAGVSVGPDGSIFVADPRSHRIRRIAPDGTVSTVAGNGNATSAGDQGLATDASFTGPTSVLADADGNLLVVDEHRIRFVNLGTSPTSAGGTTVLPGQIDTIAGSGTAGFQGDGDFALEARFNFHAELPTGMVLDGSVLYIADHYNNRIRSIGLDSALVETVAGTGSGGFDGIGLPVGVAVHDGHVYWSQLEGHAVKRMRLPGGPFETVAGNGYPGYFGDGGLGTDAQLRSPKGILIDGDGVLYIADGSHRIRRIRL